MTRIFLLLAALLTPAASAARPGLESLGANLAAAAKRAHARRVSVASFEVPPGLSPWAGASAAEGFLRGFVRSEKSAAIERGRLEQLLSERRLAMSGAVDGPAEEPTLAPVDAVVLGRLRRTPSGWKAEARLVSSADGVVLDVSSVDLEEEPEAMTEEEGFPPIAALRERAEGLSDVAATDVLEDWLARSDLPAAHRAPAALALANTSEESTLALGEALHDPEPLVRLCAALGLGKAKAAWAEGALVRMLLQDASWSARYGAAIALGRLGTRAAASALAASLSRESSWQVRQQTARSLASCARSPESSLALKRALEDREPIVRAAASAALGATTL